MLRAISLYFDLWPFWLLQWTFSASIISTQAASKPASECGEHDQYVFESTWSKCTSTVYFVWIFSECDMKECGYIYPLCALGLQTLWFFVFADRECPKNLQATCARRIFVRSHVLVLLQLFHARFWPCFGFCMLLFSFFGNCSFDLGNTIAVTQQARLKYMCSMPSMYMPVIVQIPLCQFCCIYVFACLPMCPSEIIANKQRHALRENKV